MCIVCIVCFVCRAASMASCCVSPLNDAPGDHFLAATVDPFHEHYLSWEKGVCGDIE